MNLSNESLRMIEQNHLDHFAFLPNKLGFDVGEINGVTVINCGLQTSMFNIAYGSPKAFTGAIHEIKQAFSDQPFAWWIPPTQHNTEVSKTLVENGFVSETIEHAMICELTNVSNFTQKTDLVIKYVTNS